MGKYERKCFACDRPLRDAKYLVDTRDAQTVYVGPDCFKKIVAAGEAGYLPQGWKDLDQGGLRLYLLKPECLPEGPSYEYRPSK